MFGYDKVLPFINKSKIVGHISPVVPRDKILKGNLDPDLTRFSESQKNVLSTPPKFILVEPIGLFLINAIDYWEYLGNLIWLSENNKKLIEHNVPVLDYGSTSLQITVLSDPSPEQEGEVSFQTPNLNFYSPLISTGLIEAAQEFVQAQDFEIFGYNSFNFEIFEKEINEALSSEDRAFLRDLQGTFTLSPRVSEESDKIEQYLRSYFKSGSEPLSQVPMLVGNTAVAKSALVKSVVNDLDGVSSFSSGEYGFRLIDFRAAFVDKSDIEGFQNIGFDPALGRNVSSASPMLELVEASDQYLAWIRDCLKKMIERSEKAQSELTSNEFKKYLEKVEFLKQKAKTPILFFDEVTRAPTSVLNAFTTILNEKEFLSYTMKEARLVAATNAPAGVSPEELQNNYVLADLFATNPAVSGDPAILTRFAPMPVLPQDVVHRWLKYMKNKKKMHPVLFSFLLKNFESGGKFYYDFESVENFFHSSGEDTEVLKRTPFPNFRTWDFVDDYLKSKSENTFSSEFLKTLIGDKSPAHFELEAHLKDNGWANEDENSNLDSFSSKLESGLRSNVPVLFGGPTSYGKTFRVTKFARENGYSVIKIPLSMKDRAQIRGIPDSIPLTDTVFGKNSNNDLTSENFSKFISDLEASSRQFGVPEETTENVPDSLLLTKFHHIEQELLTAKSKGTNKIILFFDEVNRVSDPTILSAVFEAVSDKRILGFSWEKPDLRSAQETLLTDSGKVIFSNGTFIPKSVKVKDEKKEYFSNFDQPANPDFVFNDQGLEWMIDFYPQQVQVTYDFEIHFDVKIVTAANVGPHYSAVQPLDPAFAARFAMVIKEELDEGDAKGYKDYVANSDLDDLIKDFISGLTEDEVLEALNSATPGEDGLGGASVLESVPISRAIENLSHTLKYQANDRQDICGAVIYSYLPTQDPKRPIVPDNWVGFDDSKKVDLLGKELTGSELNRLFLDLYDDKETPEEEKKQSLYQVQNALIALEAKFINGRNYVIESMIGKSTSFSRKFMDFYNRNVGKKKYYKIGDLKNKEMVREYVTYELSKADSSFLVNDSHLGPLIKIVLDIYEHDLKNQISFDGGNIWWALFDVYAGKGGVLTQEGLWDVLIQGSEAHPKAFMAATQGLGNRNEQLKFFSEVLHRETSPLLEDLFLATV